ncbi:MAG: hypothetical protein HC888_13425 [Candidatus Competibacteraceae bacterium]|nr:hypothetical protein [Candidatus Competibacteraceae bacterium]
MVIKGMRRRFYPSRPHSHAGFFAGYMAAVKSLALTGIALSLVLHGSPALCDAPLQGNVQETGAVESPTFQPAVPMLAPVVKEKKKKLEGEAQGNRFDRSGPGPE